VKSLLRQLGFSTSVGICIEIDSIAVCEVAHSLFGPIEIHRSQVACTELDWPQILEEQLTSIRSDHDVMLVVGLPRKNTFFSTRPIQPGKQTPGPHALLREALRTNTISVEDMAVDVVRSQPRNRTVASIAACPRQQRDMICEVLGKTGFNRYRLEPSPSGLLRMVEHSGKTRSRGGVILRVFLNETEGTAMLAVRNQMVLWRDFRLTPGDEANAILAACRTLESLSPHCGIDSKPDAVEIHGRLELKPLVNFDWVEEQLSCPIRWHSNPTLDAGTTAFGLALGGVEDQSQLFDLARTVKPEETARLGFPWRAVAYQAMVVLSMAIFLSMHYQQVSTKHQRQLVQNRSHPWLAETTELDLRKQKKDAEIRLSAIRVFLESRVVWSDQTHEIISRLPNSLSLTYLHGVAELPTSGKKSKGKARQSFVIRGQAPAIGPESAQPQIGGFVESLRNATQINSRFPDIELSDLQVEQATSQEESATAFTVEFFPRQSRLR
jgi:hypothetical protein